MNNNAVKKIYNELGIRYYTSTDSEHIKYIGLH